MEFLCHATQSGTVRQDLQDLMDPSACGGKKQKQKLVRQDLQD